MERLHEKLAFTLLQVDVADGSEGNAATGVKGMDHAIGRAAALELVLKHPKHVCRDVVQFELGMVAQSTFPLQFFDVLASQVELKQFALLRQGLLKGSDNFGNRRPSTARKGDHVSVAGNVDASSIVLAFDQAGAVIDEQFGVNGSTKDAEDMLGNRGSNRKHGSSLPVGDAKTSDEDCRRIIASCSDGYQGQVSSPRNSFGFAKILAYRC